MSSPELVADDAPADVSVGRIRGDRTPRKLRNLELILLLAACAINGGAIYLVQLAVLDTIDPTPFLLTSMLTIAVLALHITVRSVAPDADPIIIPVATLLNGMGIAQIYRIDLIVKSSGWEATANRQVVWTALAIVLAILVLLFIRNHRVLLRYTYIAGILALVLLLLPLAPIIGKADGGAQVWINLGMFSFQPGEIAKILLAIFFAGYLVRNRDSLSMVGKKFLWMSFPRIRDLGPIMVFWLLAMSVLVFQRDLGTSLLYFGLFLVMIYVATGRASWVFIGLGLFLTGAVVASQSLDYVNSRFRNWLTPFDQAIYDAKRSSYQLVQGLFGLAHGGMSGTGLGQGRPNITPLPQSDYIVGSIGEELGLVGIFVLLALYAILVARGLRIGFAGRDDFGKMLATGLSFALALQVFIVIGGITRVIPLTGLTAPFLAAGGSSLLSNWIIVALFLRLSDTIRNQPKLVIDA
ncbi:FtsW/RodA/SpoVE family cell cycle protein [Klugiella xanthotipulae]|uniref:Cell elongation-specific peptidoglycan biosynthesis regulator RodA n=1 Tax=Klugiella xanthotipulae TaxID=244735 RepID=A0A543I6V6_9MICO|nr:FtsW/RodA/SpoVE family cell cycle protein [Klugiella xanthotipulae]TQM66334.1 cell elongation-specific peptidoglycan biosynthesis regulator RodA [Klugiella xanthotipulae]